jgi:hypothetical protein
VRIRKTQTREKIIVVDCSEIIETIRCQGGHVAKGHHSVDSQSEEVKELFVRIRETRTREKDHSH